MQHEALLAVDPPGLALAHCARGDIGQVIARPALLLRKGEQQVTRGDARNQLSPQLRRCSAAQQPAAEHHGGEIRLQHQRAAERLHHDHGLDRAAAEPAIVFGEGQPEQAELGVLRPHRA